MRFGDDNQKTIYILLTYTGSLLSKVIKKYIKCDYTHVSLSLDIDLTELCSFGRLRPTNPFFAGFVKEDIKNGTYAYFTNTKCCLYSIDVDIEQHNRLKEWIHRFRLEKDKYSYNLIGFLGVIINRPIYRRYSYFCSQFVAYILEQSGIKLFDKHPALVTPYDFQTNPRLNKIYEGRLMEYNPISISFEQGGLYNKIKKGEVG